MVPAYSSSMTLAYAYGSRAATGRLNLPVSASEVIYANFEHVSGVAAPAGSGTMSIDSLKILDILIDRLESIKNQPLQSAEAPKDLSRGRVDALIEQYSAELHAAATAPARPYAPPPPAPTGMLFSLAA
jgi:hypothetical protein